MALCTPESVSLTDRERTQLQTLVRQHETPQQLATRARIILEADAGRGLEQRLSDKPRPGTPPPFTPEQICAFIALTCETPVCEGVTLTRWTGPDLAAEAIEHEIVERISLHSIGRFLREVDLKPHRVEGWINTPRDGDFTERCHAICETYRPAPERAAEGIETCSIDEMTCVQALERAAPTKPVRPECAERQEFEYIRQRHADPDRQLLRGHREGLPATWPDAHRRGFRRLPRRTVRPAPTPNTVTPGHGQPQHPLLRGGFALHRRGDRLPFIPGPACPADNGNARALDDAEGYVYAHNGIHDSADLSSATYDWRNPVAIIKIGRTRNPIQERLETRYVSRASL